MNWFSKSRHQPDAAPAAPPRRASTPPGASVADVAKLRQALAGAAGDEDRVQAAGALGRALAASLDAPLPDDPPGAWVAAVCNVPDKALALTWAAGVAGDASLAEVALQGRFAEVRLAAARRIGDSSVLERVAHLSREKDRGVYRHCFDLLRQRREAGERAQKAADVAAELRGMLENAPLPASRVLELEKEVRALGGADPSLGACNTLLGEARARLQQESLARRDLEARRVAAESLLAECRGGAFPEAVQLADWRARLASLSRAQSDLPAWLTSHALSLMIAASLRDIESRLEALAGDAMRVQECEQFLAGMTAATSTDFLAEASAWAALAKPEDTGTRQSLESRWHDLLRRHAPPEPEPAPVKALAKPSRHNIDHEGLRRLLEKLEREIEQGHLAEAEAAAKDVADFVGTGSLHGAMESRMQRATAQLGELRGWARWGTEQAREHLITAAEQLLGEGRGIDDLAREIPALREQWKRLNAHGQAASGQWRRFDSVLEKAYQPVAARQAEQAAQQEQARAAKEALCAGWETDFAAVDWEHADFKAIESRHREMMVAWRAAAHAGFRDERKLRKRFDKLRGEVEKRLGTARAAERERRERLIAEAELLAALPELGRAITEARSLQESWNREAGPLRLDRGEEQKLWRRFRAACDAVFARRDAEREKQAAERNARDALRREQAQAREQQQQAKQRVEAEAGERHRRRFELLAQKAALAERIEAAAIANLPTEELVASARLSWDALPRLQGRPESLLAARLAAAPSATAAELEKGREARESMLLDLEIALGLPSAEINAEARRRRQLQLLKDRFGAGSAQAAEPEAILAQWYATPAAGDPAMDLRIAAVVSRLAQQGPSGASK